MVRVLTAIYLEAFSLSLPGLFIKHLAHPLNVGLKLGVI